MKIMKIMKIKNEFIFLNNPSIIIFLAIIHNKCIFSVCKNPHTLKNTKMMIKILIFCKKTIINYVIIHFILL